MFSSRFRSLGRRTVPLGLPVCVGLLLAAGSSWPGLAAQDPARKPPPVEEPDKGGPPKKVVPVEEPDTAPGPKKVVPVDDDAVARPAGKLPPATPRDLATAARQAKSPILVDLYQSLAVPHDRVVTQSKLVYDVEPLRWYIGNDPRKLPDQELTLRTFNPDWTPGKELQRSPNAIDHVDSYEELALSKVQAFLRKTYDRERPDAANYLSRQQMLEAAETVLSAVHREHLSLRERNLRDGPGWPKVEADLRQELLGIKLLQLNQLAAAKDWENVAALARQLAETFPAPGDRKRLGQQLTDLASQLVKQSGNETLLRKAAAFLRELEGRFPDFQASAPIENHFRTEAEQLFAKAQADIKGGKSEAGLSKLRQAEELFPRLPGLRAYRLEQEGAYPILRVGVRRLPEKILPGLACLDSEKQAIELVFEGLVKSIDDPNRGQLYVPSLAVGRPHLVPMGRSFQLPRDTYWPDKENTPINAYDVRSTARLMKFPSWPGYRPAWVEMVEETQIGADPHQVTLTLSQGYLDPLVLMDFKILPQWVTRDSLERFAQEPVGSGPYQFKGKGTAEGRECVRFLANPNYGTRADRLGLPFIREIQFFVTTNAAEDLQKGRIDFCPDVPTDQFEAVKQLPGVQILDRVPNRRVYFLAVNYRKPELKNSNLRRALALAINRDALLTSCFRAGHKEFHTPLRGPYPAGSWAYPEGPAAAGDPFFNKFEADKLMKAAKNDGLPPNLELRLLYPDDDPRVAKAMEELKKQVEDALGLKLNLMAREPHKLREMVEVEHSYDLAYYSHDYASEAYWLSPLFDPNQAATAPGGSNYLGYANDSELWSLFRAAMSHRNFQDVRNATWAINALLEKSKMPLIPLWQLDKHLAYRTVVKPAGNVDPLLVFTQIDHWEKPK